MENIIVLRSHLPYAVLEKSSLNGKWHVQAYFKYRSDASDFARRESSVGAVNCLVVSACQYEEKGLSYLVYRRGEPRQDLAVGTSIYYYLEKIKSSIWID